METFISRKARVPLQRTGFSEFLHDRRNALGKRWKQILSDAYLSRATLHRIRNGDPRRPIAEVDSLRALAHALRFDSWADLVRAFEQKEPEAGLHRGAAGVPPAASSSGHTPGRESDGGTMEDDALISLSRAMNLSPTELARRLALGASMEAPAQSSGAPPMPAGIRANEVQPVRWAPHFASGVAASKRVEKLEDEDHESKQAVSTADLRVFSVPVDGDCQEPRWKDGETVIFSFDAYEREGIQSGRSYYIAFTDGSSTFKRVFTDPEDPEVYILRCWNNIRYPGERRVHFNEVVRIARAVAKQVNPED